MSASDPVTGLLVAIPTVIVACRGGSALARRIGQPPVVGEIAAGILLGPSLLGLLWPTGQAWLLPPESIPYTGALGQLALLVFMFLIGLELDLKVLRGLGRTALVVSQASISVPLLLGVALASAMYTTMAPDGVRKLPFVLFIGVALSITAFPVLARILTDRGMYHTPLGALAMACAAVNDAMAWCLLAVVVTITRSGSALDPVVTVALSAFFLVAMLYVIRPALARWTPGTGRAGRHTPDAERDGLLLLTVFAGICLSSLVTDRIGLHALFGAFVFGLVLPRGSLPVERAATRLRTVVVPLLLPLFFAHTGLRTNIGMLGNDLVPWLWAAAITAVAVLGKWGGSAVAARACGQGWRNALSLGVLMNCRGLTELVILNIGLELGLIGLDLFTMLVLMALVTTALTSPALDRLRRREVRGLVLTPGSTFVPDAGAHSDRS
ncbi:cation:proton antiporter [Streptomyces sp. DH8]|uniref:cation:proton antiporter n=1 Tax=Streptomyces sp. DH8 TaxID=2857008 RepID=UPI001E4281B1|nr:cation:proton antiporter [Streptomyces sp. DH8]